MRSSSTNPIRIDRLTFPNGACVGMTLCPGKFQAAALTGAWARDLDADLAAIRDEGTHTLVTLMERHEFASLRVERLPQAVSALGLQWRHLPIDDQGVPDEHFESRWQTVGRELHQLIDRGHLVVLHCMGGLGRTGLVATRLLIERGIGASTALARVRAARPGTVETPAQERWLFDYSRNPRLHWRQGGDPWR